MILCLDIFNQHNNAWVFRNLTTTLGSSFPHSNLSFKTIDLITVTVRKVFAQDKCSSVHNTNQPILSIASGGQNHIHSIVLTFYRDEKLRD